MPTLVAALAGSSWHVLTGPTNALSLALAAGLAPLAVAGSAEYLRLALVLTLMLGLIQLALALLRLGTLAHFIAPSVLLGFTSGAAVLIALHAMPDAGLVVHTGADAGLTLQPWRLAVAMATVLAALVLRRLWPRGPSMLLALVVGTVTAFGLQRGQPAVAAALPLVGLVPVTLPQLAWPDVRLDDLPRLAALALALTLVALGQSVAIAKALAARSAQVLDVNREVFGQGLANTLGACCSAFASCGSLNRSLPHWQAGARTPLAGVLAALLLLLLVWVAGPVLAWVPMAAIAALLLVVAGSLIDTVAWRELLRLDAAEAAVAAATLAATLLLPLQVAVLAGVAASLVLYLYRTAHPALRHMGFDRPPAGADSRAAALRRPFVVLPEGGPECPQLTLLRMEGSVWFGAAAHVADALQALRQPRQTTWPAARHLLVMAKSMNFIDAAGVALWEQERQRRLALDGSLHFHRPRPQVLAMWQRSGFIDRLGRDHLHADKRSAIAALVPRLDPEVCARCTLRLFEECAQQPGPPARSE